MCIQPKRYYNADTCIQASQRTCVFSFCDPEYTHDLEWRHEQSVSIRVLIDNQLVLELGNDLPIEYTLQS